MQISSIAVERCISSQVLRAMFAARKHVFVDLLGWDVPVIGDTYEIDQFDTEDAVYLIITDERGHHRASTRLLRTDGPHILGSLFPALCERLVPSGPAVREITRFCIEPTLTRSERRKARDELVTAVAEHAFAYAIEAYSAVATKNWFGQIERFGWDCRALGPIRRIGSEDLVALQINIEERTLAGLIEGGVDRKANFDVVEFRPELVS